MKVFFRSKALTLLLVLFGLMLFGAAPAQEENAQEENREENTTMIAGEEFAPFGDIDVGEPEALETDGEQEDLDTGAIVFTGSTPDDQHPNVDLVGPNGYYHHFEFDDDAGAEHVIEDLEPGVYSVAATDDGLQLNHTMVEVSAGQSVVVSLNLNRAVTDFVPGSFAGRTTRPFFPANGFQAGDTRPIDDQRFGAVDIETDNEDARFVVTGPDAYSEEFTGAFAEEGLLPGVYVIAGTAEGGQVTTATVEVEVSRAVTMIPTIAVSTETEQVDGQDVAGGGAGEEGEADKEEANPGEADHDAGDGEQSQEGAAGENQEQPEGEPQDGQQDGDKQY